MQPFTKDPPTVLSQQPSWDYLQISLRAWVDDILTWIPTCDATFAPLIERGYVLTFHVRVVVANKDHLPPYLPNLFNALAFTYRSYVQSDTIVPSSCHQNSRERETCRRRALRSAPASAPQPTALTLSSESADHFVVSLEFLANVDRQLMKTILETLKVNTPRRIATRIELRSLCARSGRDFIRVTSQRADNARYIRGHVSWIVDRLLTKLGK
eukprot:6190360-Pleurochrysis_carterae.AAC.2